MPTLRSFPTRKFCRLVDRTLAASRNGPALTDVVKRRLRGLAKAADDIERGRLRGVVWVEADVADWLESQVDQAEPPISAASAETPAESPISAAADPQTEESPDKLPGGLTRLD